MTDFKGASADEWFHFDMVLGLGENLLPCVPAADDVRVLKGSALEGKIGKIPSQFNYAGEAHGLKDWQKRPIMSNEIVAWSKDRRLNLCIRLGERSGVYAFDIDIDSNQAADVRSAITTVAGRALPARTRENSQKILLAFRMETPCKKRKIKLDNNPKGPAIELLADGQQFVACGSHSSGARYQWLPSLPDHLPTLTLDQVNRIWATLTQTYATTSSKLENQTASAQDQSPTSPEVLTTISDIDWKDLIDALKFLVPHAGDEQVWAEIGMALLSIKDCGKPVRQLWLDFSKKAPNWQEGAAEAWWESHIRG